jgi:putative PIN family toxin of toxin-antitoxin system
MIIVTLDTNVLVSGIVGYSQEASTPGSILRRFRAHTFHLIISKNIQDELDKTLGKPYFNQRLGDYRTSEIYGFVSQRAKQISITFPVHGIATHAQDDLVLATAVRGNADYLVTGDQGLLSIGSYRGVMIVTPRSFLDILDNAINLP